LGGGLQAALNDKPTAQKIKSCARQYGWIERRTFPGQRKIYQDMQKVASDAQIPVSEQELQVITVHELKHVVDLSRPSDVIVHALKARRNKFIISHAENHSKLIKLGMTVVGYELFEKRLGVGMVPKLLGSAAVLAGLNVTYFRALSYIEHGLYRISKAERRARSMQKNADKYEPVITFS
jgi:hypothetical protein